jgi:catechol 2,3-dioxygenase-like lactoylglutathione lyase family enzyme
MLTSLRHLGLEVKYLDAAREFYVDRLGLEPTSRGEQAFAVRAGETTLVLRRPTGVPRGGLHTHYAFSTPPEEYDSWHERLADLAPVEHDFGGYQSLYVYDPDGHCVEIGNNGTDGSGLTGIFEVVLEVEDLANAEQLYANLGFEPVDRGTDRRRLRLRGPFDLELWEPQLGIADARGGVHVDLGIATPDPEAAADRIAAHVDRRTAVDGGVSVRTGDCHWLTFLQD